MSVKSIKCVATRLLPNFFLVGALGSGSIGLMADEQALLVASTERGAQLFQQYCTECHGKDGRAQMDVISDATDLTDPYAYYSGTSEQEIFNSIANGAGVAMPGWRMQLGSDEKVQDLVNFVQSLME
tara:strand:- start:70709 stop:71089 length:381 start_codon:yes stop_codon:yes gene_type:complete